MRKALLFGSIFVNALYILMFFTASRQITFSLWSLVFALIFIGSIALAIYYLYRSRTVPEYHLFLTLLVLFLNVATLGWLIFTHYLFFLIGGW
ncbi:hypothetical protein EQV77_04575 [Halobacillus fulvus]|nr:hypothetical protein EQV77_04575 [Halobacillus fulvus]